MKQIFLSLALLLSCAILGLAQNQTVYTSTRTSACRTIESDPTGAGFYVGECAGTGGYKIQVIEGDIRQSINVITPSRKKFELNFTQFYGSFSSVGERIEWRTKRGVPVALIVRYNVADPEGVKKDTSYLMVSKIGKTSSCVTDIVPPGPGQNETARTLADAASGKPCKPTE